ncbi:15871_t:CDS:2 [Racocetra fulgida]|uniref:15871_t:CDS:1 n=1 Tax=Racocetra fulgida TaxID=60492 RepID=A0A9N9DTB6_9GLOM|nr:15871_t:CDS:2 [Racocetra fulgida]
MTKKRLTLEDACAIARNQDKLQLVEMENVFQQNILIVIHIYYSVALKDMNFLQVCIMSKLVTLGAQNVARQIAISRNGDCISTIYYNNHSALLWRCENNYYIFTATLNAIKNQHTWCPFCSKKREDLCRKIITKYLGLPSRIRKPDFLKTPKYPTGLKLDIPYYDYGFAIEVQGIQHERQIKFFHPNFEDFEKQQERDQLKEELCEENWIVLRYVWYYEDPFEKIPAILRELGLIP